ncbi:MAG: efflux RND transporter periplasmic adaptor subunit [Bacteroidota bacterium]
MESEKDQSDISRLRIRRDADPVEPERRPFMWKLWGPIGVVVILIVVAVAMKSSFSGTVEVEIGTPSLTNPAQASSILTASGYVVAQKKAAVASKGTGRLVYLGVEEGDRVKKGQIIARLEDSDVRATLDRTRADLEVVRADEKDASRSLARTQQLFNRGLASQADLDAAQARFDKVHASILSARAAVREAEVGVEYTLIRAPFSGTVLTKDADVGEVMAPFAAAANSRGAVVTMADMSSLQVEADVSESNIARVKVGQPCEIVLDANPSKSYKGYVHMIVPTADRSKATILTKVAFLDIDKLVLPEMSAKVSFLAPGTDTTVSTVQFLSVPSASVVTRDGKPVVFVVQEGKAIERPVQTGRSFGNRIEVLQGLSQEDRIVLNPGGKLTSGTSVTQKAQ